MTSDDISNDPRPDSDPPTVPPTIVAEIDGNGLVTIYDEEQEAAWISSTSAIQFELAL